MPAVAVAVVGLVLQTYSIIQQEQQAKKQAKFQEEQAAEQRKRYEAEQKIAEIRNIREQRQNIRTARAQAANIANTAAAKGVGTSSGAQGGVASIQSQLASNLGFFNQVQGQQEVASAANIRTAELGGMVAQSQARSAQWGAIGQLGSSMTSFGMQAYGKGS